MNDAQVKAWNRWLAGRGVYGKSPAKFDHQLCGWLAVHHPDVMDAALEAVIGHRIPTEGT